VSISVVNAVSDDFYKRVADAVVAVIDCVSCEYDLHNLHVPSYMLVAVITMLFISRG